MFDSTVKKGVLAAAVLTAVVLAAFAAGTGGVAASSAGDPADGAGRFTACMRSHGLPGFPEVSFSSDGLVDLDIRGERVDVMSRKYGAAVKACEPLLPAGSRSPGAPAAPAAPVPPF
ncbi:hypothetical protein [Streptosporangium pseudovulgare]|uniref:Uncharacterized protein n=1 Tax=Streptosporangium pseudovulgare TaxID=35765 RepID=A0ABQ2R3Z0_9ACTN|nr:hypothetical protein [Streptosporangium pseudovulgare]GGQ07538.1 hypothetical protein GCM10010140_42220 [Streptosporangium pseudovulgare]